MKLSHSELATWTRCHRKWFLNYYLGYGPDPRAAVPTGTAALGTRLHSCLEAHYGYNLDALAVLNWLYASLLEERPDYEKEIEKEKDLAFAIIEGFLDWAAESGFDMGYQVIATEQETSVTLPLPQGAGEFTLIAKLDQLIRRQDDGAVLLRDWKPQPLSEPVLTPSGWTKMGNIQPGDIVCGAHGEPVRVIKVLDRGVDDVYRVNFSDNTSVRATADHPWLVRPLSVNGYRIRRTDQLKKGYQLVPYSPHRDIPDAEVPLDPYLLGTWLANGDCNLHGVTDGETGPLLAAGLIPVLCGKKENVYIGYLSRKQRSTLTDLGFLGVKSQARCIPDSYKYGTSFNQRLQLLRGLMDGDGTQAHSVYYSTVSPQLAEDFAELVRSLGGWAKVWENRKPTYTGTIERRVIIRTPFNPFEASRRARMWQQRENYLQEKDSKRPRIAKTVAEILPDGVESVRCLLLDSEEHLYVTSGHAVSHNSVGTLSKVNGLPRDTQMKTYSMMLALQAQTNTDRHRADGGQYVMLLRSKRTARARGPFYAKADFIYNSDDLNSTWLRVRQIAGEIHAAREQLNAGVDHRQIVYPSPGEYCEWGCQFRDVCHLLDDGSRWEDAMRGEYVKIDPYQRYSDDTMERIRAAFGSQE